MPNKLSANDLSSSIVWVRLTYADRSEFCFQTTLNPTLLNQKGIVLEEGKLVRLDKQYFEHGRMVYKQFNFEGAKVSIWDEECYTDEKSDRIREFL